MVLRAFLKDQGYFQRKYDDIKSRIICFTSKKNILLGIQFLLYDPEN
jgi:hypothetical protein